jgi:hypothetical protein
MIKTNENTTNAGNGLFPEMQLNDPRQFFGMIHPVNGLVHMGNDLPSWIEDPEKRDPGNLLFLCTYRTVAAKRNLRRAGKTARSNPRLALQQFLRLYDNGEAIVGTWPGTEPVFDFCIASLAINSL